MTTERFYKEGQDKADHEEVSAAARARRTNHQPESMYVQAVLSALEKIGEPTDGGFTTAHMISIIQELGIRRLEDDKLRIWLNEHTKVNPHVSATESAIHLLDTARLMIVHLTPAVMGILQTAVSALQSAGVDIPNFSVPTEPSLGLATTRELLNEIRVRGEVDNISGDNRTSGEMGGVAANLLDSLSRATLDYRTVDEH